MASLIQKTSNYSEWMLGKGESLSSIPRAKSRVEAIVIAYNSGPWIAECLSSVLRQDYSGSMAIFVHDDGSNDETADIAKQILSESSLNCTLVRRSSNSFSAEGGRFYREILSSSNSEFLALLDADDIWLSNDKIKKQVEYMESNHQIALSFHDYVVVPDQRRSDARVHPSYLWKGYSGSSVVLGLENFVGTSTAMLKSRTLKKIDWEGYDNLDVGDLPIWIRMSDQLKIGYVEKLITFYRLRNGSLSVRSTFAKAMKQSSRALEWSGLVFQNRWTCKILWTVLTVAPVRFIVALASTLLRRTITLT